MTVPYRVFVWLPLLQRLFVLRLVNALCFLATVALTWMLAGDLFRGVRWKQTLAAGAVALQPQLGSISAVINADNLLIALTTGFILAAVRLAMYGPSLRRVIIASALAAAASLTHGRGLVTVPVLCVALLVAVIRDRPPLLAIASRAAVAGGFVAGALLVDYLVENSSGGGSLYGGQVTNLNTTSAFSLRQFASFAYQFFFPRLASLRPRIGPSYGYRQVFIDTFYATFASLEVAFKPRVADVLQVASALGLVGFYTACVARWRTLVRDWGPVVVMLTMVIVQVVFLLYVSYQALLNNLGTDPLIVGRYLLPVVSLFGVAIAFTVGSLPRRAGPVLGAAILAVGLLLCLGGVAITAARFYA